MVNGRLPNAGGIKAPRAFCRHELSLLGPATSPALRRVAWPARNARDATAFS